LGFFEEVYKIVRQIPKGKVTSYGEIARNMGQPKKAKIVGWALHANPFFGDVPCHRVVNKEGKLSGSFAFGGIEVQRKMLIEEGIIFEEDGTINLQIYLWKPEQM
jgi:methylated-DNA-protein-cysteine methyltransferase related protein